MRAFVIPDLHGRMKLAYGLLAEAGLIDEHGDRVRDPAVTTIQLGDLANCAKGDRDHDLALLRKARGWFDVLLIGNHEHPYFGGPRFNGFWPLPEVSQAVRKQPWKAAYSIGDTLLTHAGLAVGVLNTVPHESDGLGPYLAAVETAENAAAVLNIAWRVTPDRSPLFTAIGRSRGGNATRGGVLWSDFREDRRDYRFSQVHGHTPLRDGPKTRRSSKRGTFAIDLDVGSKHRIVGLWLDADGLPDGFVEYQA